MKRSIKEFKKRKQIKYKNSYFMMRTQKFIHKIRKRYHSRCLTKNKRKDNAKIILIFSKYSLTFSH